MSPRPIRLRKISNPPSVSGFRPYGNADTEQNPGVVLLHCEEYESLRLCDYEMMNHYQASVAMNISRPTLTRIYSRARQKIAEALVEGKQIIIEGGKIYYDSDWYQCGRCMCYFNHPNKHKPLVECPLCGNNSFSNCVDFNGKCQVAEVSAEADTPNGNMRHRKKGRSGHGKMRSDL